MKNFRKELKGITRAIVEEVNKLKQKNNLLTFFSHEEYLNGDISQYVEARNPISGDSYDAHAMGVCPDGFIVVDMDGNYHTIDILDFSSVEFMLDVLELYEQRVEESSSLNKEFFKGLDITP